MPQPTVPPVAIRYLKSEPFIRRALRSGKSDPATIAALAAKIFKLDMQANLSIERQISDLLTVSYSMLMLKSKVHGNAAVFGKAAKLGVDGLTSRALCAQIALHGTYVTADIAYVESLLNVIASEREPNEYAHTLVWILNYSLKAVNQLQIYAESHLRPASTMLDQLGISLARIGTDIRGVNDEMATEMARLRRYGVKPCFFQDGVMHDRQQAWAFLPLPDSGSSNTAIVALSTRDSLTNLEPRRQPRPGASQTFHYDIMASLTMAISREGHLTIGMSDAAIPSQSILDQMGLAEWYEPFRLIQLLRLYDLIMPIERVRELPGWPIQPTRGLSGMMKKSTPLSQIPALVLPRLKLLDNPRALYDQLEQEVAAAQKLAVTRSLRRHAVVGHIRILPPGKTATAAARKLAWEESNITLLPGETYVKLHDRGTGDKIRSHYASFNYN